MLGSGYWLLDAGYRSQDSRYRIQVNIVILKGPFSL